MRRALHILSVALITAGIVIGVDVGMTLAWKEPLSTIYGSIQQNAAAGELDRLNRSFLDRDDVARLSAGEQAPNAAQSKRRARALARIFATAVGNGEGIGRIKIPELGLDTVIVEGTDTAALQKGPGRYPETAFPGQGRTVGVAGHRTTYLAPFRKIDEIEPGDEVVLEMPYGTFRYEVEKYEIVEPEQVEIVRDVGYERLVLTACHPLYSAAQRWAVFARLTELEPAGD